MLALGKGIGGLKLHLPLEDVWDVPGRRVTLPLLLMTVRLVFPPAMPEMGLGMMSTPIGG